MQKKRSLALIFVLTALIYHLSSPFILAASPSPSPSPLETTSNIDQVTQNIKRRLQDSLSAEGTTPASTTLRSYVGTVRDVIKDTIVIEDKDGKKNVVVTTDSVILRSPGNANIKIDDVRIDDSIIAIGYLQATDELTGRRLIVSVTPLLEFTKLSGMGVISKIGKSTITVSTSSDPVDLATTAKTIIKSTSSASLDLADLSVGDTIIFTATTTETTKTATNLMRIKTTSASPTP